MSASEFERQGGKGHIKKWRDTLVTNEPGQAAQSLGAWLKGLGIAAPAKARNAPAKVLQSLLAAALAGGGVLDLTTGSRGQLAAALAGGIAGGSNALDLGGRGELQELNGSVSFMDLGGRGPGAVGLGGGAVIDLGGSRPLAALNGAGYSAGGINLSGRPLAALNAGSILDLSVGPSAVRDASAGGGARHPGQRSPSHAAGMQAHRWTAGQAAAGPSAVPSVPLVSLAGVDTMGAAASPASAVGRLSAGSDISAAFGASPTGGLVNGTGDFLHPVTQEHTLPELQPLDVAGASLGIAPLGTTPAPAAEHSGSGGGQLARRNS